MDAWSKPDGLNNQAAFIFVTSIKITAPMVAAMNVESTAAAGVAMATRLALVALQASTWYKAKLIFCMLPVMIVVFVASASPKVSEF